MSSKPISVLKQWIYQLVLPVILHHSANELLAVVVSPSDTTASLPHAEERGEKGLMKEEWGQGRRERGVWITGIAPCRYQDPRYAHCKLFHKEHLKQPWIVSMGCLFFNFWVVCDPIRPCSFSGGGPQAKPSASTVFSCCKTPKDHSL